MSKKDQGIFNTPIKGEYSIIYLYLLAGIILMVAVFLLVSPASV